MFRHTSDDVRFDGIELDAVMCRRSPRQRPQRFGPSDFPQVELLAARGVELLSPAVVDASVDFVPENRVDGLFRPLYRIFAKPELKAERRNRDGRSIGKARKQSVKSRIRLHCISNSIYSLSFFSSSFSYESLSIPIRV